MNWKILFMFALLGQLSQESNAKIILAFGKIESFKPAEKKNRYEYTIALEASKFNDLEKISVCTVQKFYAGQPVFVFLNNAKQNEDNCRGFNSTPDHGNRVTINPGVDGIYLYEAYFSITEPKQIKYRCRHDDENRFETKLEVIGLTRIKYESFSYNWLFPSVRPYYYSKSTITACINSLSGYLESLK